MKGHRQLRKGRRSIPNQIYHVSTATHEWRPLFDNVLCGRAVVASLRHEHNAGHVESLAFVVMPDHLHWLFSLSGSPPSQYMYQYRESICGETGKSGKRVITTGQFVGRKT